MEAIIQNFRRSRHVQTTNQMILLAKDIDKEKAKSLIGKKVSWKSPAGKEIKGEIKAAHGSKGAVRALFEKGMPGQAIGTKVSII
ncbi:50S ribosomal protein L35ae [Candidatus Woesearchaeota archaeon]|nr:50S ribosomal protein L35ae [Candidatus Woesearchaeota archaeon]